MVFGIPPAPGHLYGPYFKIIAPPNPGAARDAPRTSREPGFHFRIRLYTGQYNKEHVPPVPVFGKSTRELSGHTEEKTCLGFV